MNLQDYEQKKFAIAEILRSASLVAPSDARQWQERLRELFARLAEDRFNLVVVGRFNRGKSSLMNAMIGSDRLPVGIIPLTSVLTTVTYGTTERVILKFNERILTQEVPIEALHQYVTQAGNPGNARGIKMAEVQLRAEILRRGFYFVDTPGLGSAILENTRTTEAFFPEADAFVVVSSYESPISEEEIRFFRDASSSPRRIFVVINKQDTLSAHERKLILSYVRQQLATIFGENLPQLFSVSANEGLEAKLRLNSSRLVESGIPALERALLNFLLVEKNDQFLLQMCGRIAALINDLPTNSEKTRLSKAISALRDNLGRRDPAIMSVDSADFTQSPATPPLQQLQSCEICAQSKDVLWQFECTYQYEISTNPDAQRRFAESGGLCSFHTWQYEAVASPYGICNAYPILLDRVAAWLRTNGENALLDTARKELEPPVPTTTDHCALCNVRARAESEAIAAVVKRFSEDSAATLRTLSAICIPHLAMLVNALENPDHIWKLLNQEASLIERLSEDMKRFALKRDGRRVLETKEEMTAAGRALLLLAGHQNVTPSSSCVATDRLGQRWLRS
jgi:GTP-binding protein EngB required for normal cell division